MNTVKSLITKVGTIMGADVRRGLIDPHHDFSSFQLISLKPYLERDISGRFVVNKEKPFRYPVSVRPLETTNVDNAVYGKEKIGCADDICLVATQVFWNNIEVKAHGINISLHDAMMEAARYADTQKYKYILFTNPLHSRVGKTSYILENTAAPADSSMVLVVSLVPQDGRIR